MKSHRKWVVPKLTVISSFINSTHIFYCTYFTFYGLHLILIIFIILFYQHFFLFFILLLLLFFIRPHKLLLTLKPAVFK